MKHLLRIYLLLLFCCACLHAETIFYKKDVTGLTPDEHTKMYEIMIKYQFPISAFFGTYVDNELTAMRKEIKEVLPKSGIEPAFMSTTLYQLWILYFIHKNWDNLKNVSEGILTHDDDDIRGGYQAPNPTNFEEKLKKKESVTLHRILNNFIMQTLKEEAIPFPRNAAESVAIFKKLYKWDNSFKESIYPFNKMFGPLDLSRWQTIPEAYKTFGKDSLSKVIERAIELDHKAYQYNWFPLYRGSDDVDTNEKAGYGWRSISFGSSFFGGRIYDDGACVHNYFLRHHKLVYAALIDKKSYAKGILKNMFFIPPLTGMQDFFGSGEFFHSRSKIPSLTEKNSFAFQGAIPDDPIFKKYYEIDPTGPGGTTDLYSEIRNYIDKNHVILTDNTPIHITSRKSLPPSRPLPEFIPKKKAPTLKKRSSAPNMPLPAFPQKKNLEQKAQVIQKAKTTKPTTAPTAVVPPQVPPR